jgi:hypothetical protein
MVDKTRYIFLNSYRNSEFLKLHFRSLGVSYPYLRTGFRKDFEIAASDFGTYALYFAIPHVHSCPRAAAAAAAAGWYRVGGGGGEVSGSSSPASSSLPGGAIAAVVIVPVISIILIGAAIMIRKGMIFQNVAAFQFIRPTSSPNPNPYPSTYVHSGPRNPAPAHAVELRGGIIHFNPSANSAETNVPSASPASAQQVSIASLAASIPQAPPVRSSSRSRSRSVAQLTASNRLLRTGVAIDTQGYKQMALSRPIVAR